MPDSKMPEVGLLAARTSIKQQLLGVSERKFEVSLPSTFY